MAVNADTFASGGKPIGNSSNVLVPAADDSPAPIDETTGPSDKGKDGAPGDSSAGQSGQNGAPAPVGRGPKKSSPAPSSNSGSVSTPTTYPTPTTRPTYGGDTGDDSGGQPGGGYEDGNGGYDD